jgi:carbon storage regulator
MMVMRRREGEKILIGDNIVIHIAQIGRNKVKIAIEAPRDIRVVAEEVQRVTEENTAAATASPADILQFLQHIQSPAA